MRAFKSVAMILVLHLFFVRHAATAQKTDYKGLPQWSQQQQGITNYWLYTPDNLQQGEVYPIALFLHGCCPEDEVLRLRSTVDPTARMWHHFAGNEQTIPTYIIVPVSKRGWGQHIDNLKKVMDDLVANAQGDAQRIYITGFSMGGGGTWQFLERYPDYFAAALPMGSGIRGDIDKLKDIPVWVNIGENDRNAGRLKDSVAVFRKANGDPRGALEWVTGVYPRYTEHDGISHGVLPFTGKNSETNLSKTAGFDGLTFIQTAHSDRDSSDADFLSFDVDQDVIIYIAYEKCEHLYESTIPDWLKEFKKEPGQIEAQYFYFDVYSKSFPKGKITLPGADARAHNVNNNYFVLIRKSN